MICSKKGEKTTGAVCRGREWYWQAPRAHYDKQDVICGVRCQQLNCYDSKEKNETGSDKNHHTITTTAKTEQEKSKKKYNKTRNIILYTLSRKKAKQTTKTLLPVICFTI